MKKGVIVFTGASFITYYILRDFITIHYIIFMDLILFFIFNLLIIAGIVYLGIRVVSVKKNRTDLILLIYLVCCVLIVTIFPYDKILKSINFNNHIKGRNEVVRMLSCGDVVPDSLGKVLIPEVGDFKCISAYNEIYVYLYQGKTLTYFPANTGLLEYSQGFAYISSEQQVSKKKEIQNIEILYDYGSDWYYIQIQ